MIRTRVRPLDDGFSLLRINDRLALCYKALKRPGKGGRKDRVQCAYFGFDSEESAQAFLAGVLRQFGKVRAVVRESDRLPDAAFEVKIWEFPHIMSLVFHCAGVQIQPAETQTAA